MANTAVDPDAQATTTDFLDFTEYVPSDLLRSLTLIRGLDATYLSNSHAAHDLTTIYSTLPTLPPSSRPDPTTLREQISLHLDRAIDSRENAFAEADRAYQVIFRNTNRLQSILSKLQALPKPPSRDPTPQPVPSPEVKRSRSGRKIETAHPQRVILHGPRFNATSLAGQKRKRQLIVPGEPLPAYDPDSPMASTEVSDTETQASPTHIGDRQIKSLKLKAPKPEKAARPSLPGRNSAQRTPAAERPTRPRPAPPPPDAVIGSEHRPWMKLTEYEIYRTQKEMKKGVDWPVPPALYQKKVTEYGRGQAAYEAAKAKAEKEGVEFVDHYAHTRPGYVPKKVRPSTPERTDQSQETIVVAKSERKTTEKKPKKTNKPDKAREEAARADLQKALQNLSTLRFGNLFGTSAPSTPVAQPPRKKRKPASSSRPSASVSEQRATSAPKEPKTEAKVANLTPTISAPATTTITSQVPLKISLPDQQNTTSTSLSSSISPKGPSRASSRIASRQASIAPKPDPEPTAEMGIASMIPSRQSSIRPPSRRSLAASVEPITAIALALTNATHNLRRNSTPASNLRKTPKPTTSPKTEATAATRRSKRPQGAIAQSTEDGAAIIKTGRRKDQGHNASKHQQLQKPQSSTNNNNDASYIRTDIDGKVEVIPDDEPRYCICDDVSYGDMIACDHGVPKDGCQEWFHMGCVGLHDMPGRTVKWYCPNCRVKLRMGENTNGLVGRTIKG